MHKKIVSITGETDDVTTVVSSKNAMFMIDISKDEEKLLKEIGIKMVADYIVDVIV